MYFQSLAATSEEKNTGRESVKRVDCKSSRRSSQFSCFVPGDADNVSFAWRFYLYIQNLILREITVYAHVEVH